MPAFPIPALPALPSLDSFRSFIDTSPPVFYPAEAANHVRPTRERRRSDHTTRPPSRSESGSREPGRSRSRSTTGITGVDSPLRRPWPQDQSGQSHTHAHTHTRAQSSSSGTLLPANASAIDLDMSGEWEPLSLPPVAGGHLPRRNSTGARAQPDINNALNLAFDPVSYLTRSVCSSSSSPGRPGHRRSHSAAPATTPGFAPPPVPPPSNRRAYAPFGRLREFSRTPLASTSAVSLPTLVELDGPNHDVSTSNETIETMSERGSPLVRPRNRRLSKASAILPASPLIPARSPPMSPLSVSDFALPPIDSSDSDGSGEVRPPREPLPPSSSSTTGPGTGIGITEAWQASSVPPPQAVGRMRPRPPARSWSQDIVDLRPTNTDPLSLFASSMTTAHGHGHGRRHSVTTASSSVSDVAVLATWSFPSSPDRQPVPPSDAANPLSESIGGRSPDHTSRRLRERLRTLSQLDTTILPGPQPLTGSGSKRPDVARSNTTVRPPLRPFLDHRHTHSSPSLLLPNFVPPNHPAPPHLASTTPPVRGTSSSPRSSPTHTAAPTRHARRPTTSRLRNPAPLSMPYSTPNPMANTNISTNSHPNPANPNPLSRPRSQSQSQSQPQSQPQPQSQSPFQIPSIQGLPPTGPRATITPQGDLADGGDRSSGLSLAIRLDLSRSRANTLSFSPGSLTDDSTSTSSILCPSPTASIVSLPPPPHLARDIHPGAISAAATVALATRDDKEVWWKRWGSRRRSVMDHAISTLKTSIEADIAGLGINDMDLHDSTKIAEEDRDGDEDLGIDTQVSLEEQFLDFDDI
ncbi:hypothetical protein JCM24511_08248 [Saitozyma sp. JCM 24511]|nr:hypothetical protein JCM24511_08248 [Saitozyma sp. JCM 24511]